MTRNEARFTELSGHVAFLIPIEKENVWKFIEGLHFGFRIRIACEAEIETIGSGDCEEIEAHPYVG